MSLPLHADHKTSMKRLILLFIVGLAVVSTAQPVGDAPRLAEVLRDSFQYRNLGPFRVGGWVSDIAVPETPAKRSCAAMAIRFR